MDIYSLRRNNHYFFLFLKLLLVGCAHGSSGPVLREILLLSLPFLDFGSFGIRWCGVLPMVGLLGGSPGPPGPGLCGNLPHDGLLSPMFGGGD